MTLHKKHPLEVLLTPRLPDKLYAFTSSRYLTFSRSGECDIGLVGALSNFSI
uniref:Uncharacterized protein n=1 Tax=Daucus carota subsp. sativus TaxID=79200 RepID=A0A166C9M8_DAUCS